jgi:LuxR family maltose regulon positive regulatory protein
MTQSDDKHAAIGAADISGSYKFYPPQPLAAAICRHRLLSDISSGPHYSAVVIQGPAGHGKTTLMQQILGRCREDGIATGWLTLDESDNDISSFNACLRTLVISAGPEQTDSGMVLAEQMGGNSAAENILHLMELIEGPVALFIDELQCLNEPANISLLDSIIERNLPNVTFYIGSRSIPNLARGRLLISGRVKWITPEELCFTAEEVSIFLGSVGLKISQQECEAFRIQTGGWPAVLQLLHLALKGGKIDRNSLFVWVKGCQSELTSYLADNVMQDQSLSRQQFLMRSSLLSRLSAPLCEAITGIKNSQQVLEDLVTQGMFIHALDVEQTWFKYHSIFSSYLKVQLSRTEPERVKKIHLSAANWFLDEGYSEEAIFHAIQAEDYQMAADALSDWMPNLICSARLQTAEHFCMLLPEEVFDSRPNLCWGLCWAQLFLFKQFSAHSTLVKLEEITKRTDASMGLPVSIQILRAVEMLQGDNQEALGELIGNIPTETGEMASFRCFEMGALSNLKAIHSIQVANFSEARDIALLAESLGNRGHAAFSAAYSVSLMSYAMIQDGHLVQAIRKLKEGLSNKELTIQGSLASASLSAIYGFALYESGNYIEAESHLRDTIDLISKTLPVDWLISAHLSLVRTCALADSDSSDSIECLENAEKLGLTHRLPRLVRAIRRERMRLAHVSGRCKQARLYDDMPDDNSLVPTLPDEWIHLAEGCDDDVISNARKMICCGDPGAALASLKKAIHHASSTGWLRRRIKLLILMGLAHEAIGNQERAKRMLHEAIELAEPGGYIASFVEEGEKCLRLLSRLYAEFEATRNDIKSEFVLRVLQNAGSDTELPAPRQTAGMVFEQPTKRELDILRLVVSGASNAEIADSLFVSGNTVKFHMKNLYSKLGAKNRVNLISVARSFQLI